MQTEAMKYSIELFDGKNDFALWQSTVKDILICQGLNAALEETKPADMKESDCSTIQKKAASQIWLALAPEVKYNILSKTTSIGMWRKLEEIYVSKSLTNQLDILEEEEKALLLLASLPKSYKSLVQSMLVGKTTLMMKDVTTMLLKNDKFLGEDDGANQTNALVMEHSRGRSNGCGGGYKCPKFKEDFSNMKILMKSQKTKGKGEANIVEENVIEVLACEECDLEVEQDNQWWILDFVATMHVCNNPSEFVSLVRGELGKITVATNEKVNIEGIGDVRLNVHIGRAKILKNVRYVPECSNNIIALSELTTRGYKSVRKQEWCKVYKGGRLVLRGRKNKHNIYVLKQHPERGLNKTMRKMVWKPKGILVDDKEINKTKKRTSFNNEVVFDDGSRRCDFPSDHILVQN
ncbi:hypothetical protein SLEP1_g35826 [Rubroshorea leprosula]|uniref:Retrovirus-related Pol polyprotein from transposon TNT 1-94-like beta-barrel domain-containing protein n=1 Tax=Rubroshorea leprosula TaxID=152421 RepID=A0AAV5KPY7_9ROSI|nr:hypothetical protein SLEP1_g35826 [Rubroshorea leprosula]